MKSYTECNYKPVKRIALVAGFLLVLSPHQKLNQEGTIHKNIDNKDLSLLDNIIKNNFTKDLRKILSPAFSQQTENEKEKRLETITRIIEAIVKATNFDGNSVLATVAQEIAKITNLFTRQYDVGAEFYRTFLKYWIGSGQDMGIVLTPWHIAELMVDLVDFFKGGINVNDTCLDPCAGSGTFLLAFLRKQLTKTPNIEKVKQNLIGCEIDEDIWLLSIANMLVEGDGKSNLLLQDFFTWETKNLAQLPNVGLMNPPFSKKKKKGMGKPISQAEIFFVERLLNIIERGGIVATITIISSFDNQKENQTVKERIYQNHTLKAVVNMSSDLFEPNAVYTQINVWQVKHPHEPQNLVYFYNLTDDGFQTAKKVRLDKFGKWKEIHAQIMETFRKKSEGDKFFLTDGLTAEDEWTFAYWEQRVATQKNFAILQTSQGDQIFQSVVGEYLLYQVKKKTQLLEKELRINFAKMKGNEQEAEELEKQKPVEWTTINNYLLYRWKEESGKLQLQLSEDLSFYKRALWESLEIESRFKIDKQNVPQLSEKKWKEFQISEIFDVVKGDKFEFKDIFWGECNYVTSSVKNNGVYSRSKYATQKEKCLTVDNSGNGAGAGISFYQEEPFCTNSAITILKPKKNWELNVYRGLFLNTILRQNMKYYHYGWKRSPERLIREMIMLPVNYKGEIDWEWMDIYIYIAGDCWKEQGYRKYSSDYQSATDLDNRIFLNNHIHI